MLVLLRRSQQHALVRRRRRRPCPSCSDADANAYCVALESQTPRRAKGSSSANCVVCWNYLCGDSSLILSLFAYVALFFWLTPKSLERTDLCLFSSEFFFRGYVSCFAFFRTRKRWWLLVVCEYFFLFTHIGQTFGYPIGRRSSSLFGNGDFRWGFCTWLYVLCPFVVLLLLFCLLGRFSAANNVCIYGPRHQIRRPGWQWSGVRGKEKRRKKYNDAAHLVGPTARNSPNDPTRRPEGFCLKLGPVLVCNVLRFWRLGAPFRRVNSKSQNILLFLFCWF